MSLVQAETLTHAELAILANDIAESRMVYKSMLIAIPILIIVSLIAWYFKWEGIWWPLYPILVISGIGGAGYFYIRMKATLADINGNVKHLSSFVLKEKIAEGDVKLPREGINSTVVERQKFIPNIENVKAAIQYKKHKLETQGTIDFNKSDLHEKMLAHDYYFIVLTADKKELKFMIPIEYYPIGQEGASVNIHYAPNSRMVFKVEE